MRQQPGREGRDTEYSRRQSGAEDDSRYYRVDHGADDSWMHDKERQASRAGYSDYAYDPRLGPEHGYDDDDAPQRSSGYGRSAQNDRGRGQAYSGQRAGARESATDPRAYSGQRYYDSGWRETSADSRRPRIGGEDDRGDAPASSAAYHGAGRFPAQGDPRHGYYVYGEREGPRDYDDYDPRSSGYARRLRPGGREIGEGYGRSSGYAAGSGFGESAYGAGFEPNEERQRSHAAQTGSAYREQGMRGYRGQGPRRYARSDERITEDLNERLTEDDLVDARDIEVRCSDGKVVLEGEVSARWMKHRAEDLADACSGVKDVDNRIRVRGSGFAPASAGSPGAERQPSERSASSTAGRAGGNPGSTAATGATAGASTAATTPSHSGGSNQSH
ncbi:MULTISPECIES: BON domain-containing protein [Lysobacter]|uniref:BON domain-containing protein n=1 Tax=Lysobacter TaxID=68 RepID=UPI001F2E97A6|nr:MULTISPECIES: BON domain-containing protein [Lysobacter]UJB19592.1 BON domain-containing protein [Lysobacter capsici]UJQ26682.1 BON domain-containing protein [Lysobacter gummosus]